MTLNSFFNKGDLFSFASINQTVIDYKKTLFRN